MHRLRRAFMKVLALFTKDRDEKDMEREIRTHLLLLEDEFLGQGMSSEDARRAARRAYGGVEQAKELHRQERSAWWLSETLEDIRYAFRQIARYPGFAAVVILTLALGTGADTAIFSVVNTVLLRPLPYKDPDRLVWVTERFALGFGAGAAFGPDYVAWRRENSTFEQIEAFESGDPNTSLAARSATVAVRAASVTPAFFSMLGVNPILGRSFTSVEGTEGHDRVVLLSEGLWRKQFRSDRNILGTTIHLDGSAYTVVGVLPGSVRYPEGDVWTPISADSSTFLPSARPMAIVDVIGRLRRNVTLPEAVSNLQVVGHRIDNQYPRQFLESRDRTVEILSLNAFLVRDVRSLLLILLGVVGFVFLIACANVSNLLLSRSTGRRREFAVRAALGASRFRLILQSLTESLVLALLGSSLGFLGGLWFVGFLKELIPPGISSRVRLDPRMFGFVAGIAVFATLVFGLVPALVASRATLSEALKSGGARSGTAGGTRLLRNFLVVSEITLSLILLIGAGLLRQTFARLSDVRLGFDPHGILTADIARPMTDGFDTPSQVPFFNRVLDRLRAMPGVVAAGAATRPPLSSCAGQTTSLTLREATGERSLESVCRTAISQDYFRAIGIPLLSGRLFDATDTSTAPQVTILNRALAHVAFGDKDPMGQDIGLPGLHGITWSKVVGVVSDARNDTLEQQPSPELFVPYTQDLLPLNATFVIRTSLNPSSLPSEVRKVVEEIDKDQAVSNIETLEEGITALTAMQRLRMVLLGFFALLASVLAILGIFGVMSYSVGQRTQEMAVRVALGAQPSRVIGLVVGQGMSVAALGLAAGVLGALGLTRFLSSFLYEVRPTDIGTFLAALLLLTGASLLACYLPARRASSVDPVQALRVE
jgi:putative ABC transport system permease protein